MVQRKEDLGGLLDQLEQGRPGALKRLREAIQVLEERVERSEASARVLEQRLDAWDRCYERAHEVLDPWGDWAHGFKVNEGRPSARAERMAAALRVVGLPDVEPKISPDARRFTGYVATGLAAEQALEQTLAASHHEDPALLRSKLLEERGRLELWLGDPEPLTRDHDPDLAAERIRDVIEALSTLDADPEGSGRGARSGRRGRSGREKPSNPGLPH